MSSTEYLTRMYVGFSRWGGYPNVKVKGDTLEVLERGLGSSNGERPTPYSTYGTEPTEYFLNMDDFFFFSFAFLTVFD